MSLPFSTLTHLECARCARRFTAEALQRFCPDCTAPLLARYDLPAVRRALTPADFAARPPGMWRWHELLPVASPAAIFTLGEGDTPLLPAKRLGAALGLTALFIKDESLNPTGTFKARGLAAAVARAAELGAPGVIIPTAGNAGGAMAAYAARLGLPACVIMPADTPRANQIEAAIYGAEVILVEGLISDAARLVGEKAKEGGWFDLSTFKEPYRLEGKKIMGYELAEAFDYDLPEVIVYPTGGGTGLVGMWKAFAELAELGWLRTARRPRLVVVQAEGCAPVVRAFEQGQPGCEFWQGAATLASGLRVPRSFADREIMTCLQESAGTAVAVSDAEIVAAQRELARMEGVFAAPEGAATVAACQRLRAAGWLQPAERVVVFNTGSGLKYLD